VEAVFAYIDRHLDTALDELVTYCRLPSVSAEGRAMEETARYTAALLEGEGFATQIIEKPAGGRPVVYAEQRGRSPRTLLFYNHYDVQPPDPLDEWSNPPFEPVRRGEKVYGRGVSDNKGNIVSRLLALRALRAAGGLPCGVKFFIEGDEEIGSPQIGPFVSEHRSLLAADACVWEGGNAFWDGTPTLMLGVKGLLYMELTVEGPNRDVHSSYGTVVPNPAWRLAWAIASLKGPDERILIDGFYDAVRRPTEEEEAAVRALPDESAETLASLGLSEAVLGVRDVDYRLRHVFEPILNVDGLTAGYQGPGAKTILPARASAKLDFRLVVDQHPDDIAAKLRRHLDARGLTDVKLTLIGGEPPARTPMSDPFVRLCQETGRQVYGVEPFVLPSMAATGPMYHFVHDLGLASVMLGVNYTGGRDHAPDEHIRVEDFRRGTKHVAALLQAFAAG
jgi:acetylornithine deacetylase/succinyl-diaminopimelate desuccinylase-like protein